MPTKFVFDRAMKETKDTIAEVLKIVRKKPYPNPKTTVLAGFVEAMFQVNQKKRPVTHVRHEKRHDFLTEMRKDIKKKKPMAVLRPLPMPPEAPEEPPIPGTLTLKPGEADKETLLPPAPVPGEQGFSSADYTITTFNMIVPVSVKEDESGKPFYQLNEPHVNEETLKLLKEYIKDDFEKDFKVLDNQEYMDKKLEKACKKTDVECTPEVKKNLIYYLKRDLLGFRKIDPIMYDNNINEIFCDGLNKPVLVAYKGKEKIRTNVIFKETKDLNVLLARLAKATGNELSESKPILDSTFQGYRVQAILGMGDASSKLIIKKEI